MEIDWKHLASTKGYKSLKAAMNRDIQEAVNSGIKHNRKPYRSKKEFHAKFYWVINRAKHYAYVQGRSIENVLAFWEEKRSYWWLNYYQDSNQPKLTSPLKVAPKPSGIRAEIKYYKNHTSGYLDSTFGRTRVQRLLQKRAHTLRTKKAKWSPLRKHRGF